MQKMDKIEMKFIVIGLLVLGIIVLTYLNKKVEQPKEEEIKIELSQDENRGSHNELDDVPAPLETQEEKITYGEGLVNLYYSYDKNRPIKTEILEKFFCPKIAQSILETRESTSDTFRMIKEIKHEVIQESPLIVAYTVIGEVSKGNDYSNRQEETRIYTIKFSDTSQLITDFEERIQEPSHSNESNESKESDESKESNDSKEEA